MQSEAGKLSCSKTALKRCTSTEHLWLPQNTGKSFCQGQRGAGEPTCCTHLKSLSQWVQISVGRQCWNICPPCGQRQALPLNLPHERFQLMYESANGQVTVTSQHSALPLCHGTSVLIITKRIISQCCTVRLELLTNWPERLQLVACGF